ncbi:MAG: hypothetical protein ABI591_12530 [Kofleriaceae bacterium]
MKRVAVIIVLAVIGVVSLRAVISGRAALGEGDDWMLRGKPAEAIRSYEAAARWYVPLAPHVDAAYRKLRALTEGPTALLAWRAIRSAARATRSVWQPHAHDLADADAAIAHLEARDPEAGAGAGATIEDREAWQRARLSEDVRAGRGAIALAGVGIVMLLAGAVLLVHRPKPLLIPGVAVALGTVCWLVGLYNA